MSEIDRITDFISTLGIKIKGKIHLNPNEDNQILVPIKRYFDEKNREFPSKKHIKEIKLFVENVGFDAKFLLYNDGLDREKIFKSEIRRIFGDKIRQIYLSEGIGTSKIWIELKTKADEIDSTELDPVLKSISDEHGFLLPTVFFTKNFRLPTPTAILGAVRKRAPASVRDIRRLLVSQEFTVPSLKYIDLKLDGLRKQGLILRKSSGDYTLTFEALKRMGSNKNRRSPDIGRLLALSRNFK